MRKEVTLATALSHITLCYFQDKNMVLGESCGDHVGFTFSLATSSGTPKQTYKAIPILN